MKILVIVLVCVLGLLLLARFRRAKLPAVEPTGPTSEYLDLRQRALEFSPTELGLTNEITAGPWGMIMEIYMDSSQAVVTVASFADGNASIYLSLGGGYIGGVGKPKIHDAAIAFVKAGAGFESSMVPTNAFALPQPGETVFYLRSGNRILRESASTASLDAKQHRLFKLWFAGQEVITQYRLDSGGR